MSFNNLINVTEATNNKARPNINCMIFNLFNVILKSNNFLCLSEPTFQLFYNYIVLSANQIKSFFKSN